MKRKTELTECGDTNEQGLIFWLGTESKVKAFALAAEIIRLYNKAKAEEEKTKTKTVAKKLT